MTHGEKSRLRMKVVEKAKSGSTLSQLQEEFPMFSASYMRYFCRDYGIIFNDATVSISVPTGYLKPSVLNSQKWKDVNWEKRDVDIADEIGVTRERVRQVRRKLGKPDSRFHNQHSKTIAFLQWAEQNKHLVEGKTAHEVAECQEAQGLSAYKIAQLMLRIGVTPKIVSRKTIEDILSGKTVDADTGCWHCNLRPTLNGHIRMPGTGQYDEKRGTRKEIKYVRNVAFEKLKGQFVPHGMYLVNDCGDITCINPDHQHVGTFKEVVADIDRTPLTLKEQDEILQMYRGGLSVSGVQAATGRVRATILKVIQKHMFREMESIRNQVRECIARNPGSSLDRLGRLLPEVPKGMLAEIIWAENRAGRITSVNRLFYTKKKEVRIELPVIQ